MDATAQFNVVSSDPAPLRTTQSFAVSANVFAVNELRLDGANAVLGEPFEVSLAANNMEPFSAFQLDVVLPEGQFRWWQTARRGQEERPITAWPFHRWGQTPSGFLGFSHQRGVFGR